MNNPKRSQAGRPKSTEKQRQILMSASCLFLQQGFSATSMDNVAKEANVSKQTVYSHFKNKDALFSAVIAHKCQQYQMDEEHIMQCPRSLLEVLHLVGEQFVRLLHDEEVIAMYRVVMGEVSANIHVAELFYEAGPKRAMLMLKDYLIRQRELQIPESRLKHLVMIFFNMLKGEHHMKSLMGLPCELNETEQLAFVNRVVEDFMTILRHQND
ncbi:TetR/AcrR family transcriptional regulator [Planctobacterium marinum]|uniref:TetR/AcrR family transcriptional regulator n=1 Tax=Planctobacterium marinum TaxID=1631968 RepID=UPI001E504A54|nr:TetR/AcrR family transcriptional regulator [Planctobacterium marinum]MCC2605016.1 TetR/AcrR family transcriptional regulator [Planctobacterium marinum]